MPSEPAPMAKSIGGIQELYTDGITIQGVVRRIYYHALYVFWDFDTQTEHKEWHYFGTKAAHKPPTTADPVFEHNYIQIPDDIQYLPAQMGDDYLYELAKLIAPYRENLNE
jgi:hypothetical protein